MSDENIAIYISIASAGVALFALGWNVYRDVILKPRIKVRLSVTTIIHPPIKEEDRVTINVVNFGPGNIRLTRPLVLKNKKFLRKTKHAILIDDYTDPFSAKLPCDMKVGDEKNILLKFNKDCFLKKQFTHIGIKDSFGRIHWAPRKHFRRAKHTFKIRFEENRKKTN